MIGIKLNNFLNKNVDLLHKYEAILNYMNFLNIEVSKHYLPIFTAEIK